MTNRPRIFEEWIESVEAAILALVVWEQKLREWRRRGGCTNDEFHAALSSLRAAGLEEWADRNKVGGGLDALGAAVIVKLADPDPWTGKYIIREEP